MTNHVLLNNVNHHDLRVITRYGPELGHAVQCVPTFPTEYADIQREYPIFFRREAESGALQSVAMLGLAPGENLFLEGDEWRAGYVPAFVARGPFLIGFQEQESDGERRKEPVVHVDLDDARVNRADGAPLFLEHGGSTGYLQHIAALLNGIQEGLAIGGSMYRAFESLDLIEPVKLEIDVLEDVRYVLNGFYMLNRERLAALDGSDLAELNRAGYLEGAFLVLASQSNMARLIERKRLRAAKG